jgi:hypothetical protein
LSDIHFCREIPKSREGLKLSGDMFATTMGWLGDVDGGGGTAFTSNTVEKVNTITVWAADFETPVGSSTFFSFLFFLGSIGRNKQSTKFAQCCFKAYRPYSINWDSVQCGRVG